MGLLYSCICICVFNILYFVFGVRIKLKIFPLTNQSSRLDDNPPSDWLRLHLIGWDWLRLHLIGYLKNPLSLLGNQEKLNLLSSDWLIYLRILSSVSHWQSRKTTWNMMMRISWKINNKGPRFKLYSLKKICRSTLDRQMIASAIGRRNHIEQHQQKTTLFCGCYATNGACDGFGMWKVVTFFPYQVFGHIIKSRVTVTSAFKIHIAQAFPTIPIHLVCLGLSMPWNKSNLIFRPARIS